MYKRADGFTVVEVVLALTIFGILATVSVAPIRDSLAREALRGARLTTATHLARARGAASTRGCPAVLHLGSDNRIWITSCGVDQFNVVDTVGSVDDLMSRFDVQIAGNQDSVVFEPTGLMALSGTLRIDFSRADLLDSLGVSPVGRLLW